MFLFNSRTLPSIAMTAGVAVLPAVGGGVSVAQADEVPFTTLTCTPDQLSASTTDVDSGEEGMTLREITYQVVNISDTPCSVHSAPTEVLQSNDVATTTVVGDTYLTPNGPDLIIDLQPGESAEGKIAWVVPTGEPAQEPHTLSVVLPDIGALETGFVDSAGALNNRYTVTNLIQTYVMAS